ncbi:hypothetical protein DFJ58DRAFT_185150 [Suillus subalutaceus]|uniref:uncharacterized protein n=1 Tax=Suillus subalutaceus TaxID=48586 RepID=UPI001B87B273|nr:uncharacterized protein DFJ58DRAFT_185150 [Suillus subalutaceus]KAG1864940.1 hypothetical protein DFJ58DRAFT_185150 [Suillus subalutaceus]
MSRLLSSFPLLLALECLANIILLKVRYRVVCERRSVRRVLNGFCTSLQRSRDGDRSKPDTEARSELHILEGISIPMLNFSLICMTLFPLP